MSGILAILFANIIWGVAPAIFKFSIESVPPFTLAFIRFFISGLLFIPFIKKGWHTIKPKDWPNILWGAFFGISICIGFFFMGLQYAPSINVHVISSLGPVVLYILSLQILHERPHPTIVKGMICSLFGVAIIVFGPLLVSEIKHTSSYSGQSQLIGNLFFLISTVAAALMMIFNRKLAKGPDVMTVTGIQFILGSLPFIFFMLPELPSVSLSNLTMPGWVGIIYGIFFSSALGYILQNYALTKITAQQTGIFAYIMPVIGVLVAIPLLHEFPDIFFIIGSGFILAGIIVSKELHFHTVTHKKKRKK